MLIALFEPDIPQNTGSLVRLAACTNLALHVIEPCGFPFEDKRLRRVSMDYYDLASVVRHRSWQAFLDFNQSGPRARLVLLTTHARDYHIDFEFKSDDILLFGSESGGVPPHVREAVDRSVKIPMQTGARSLNLVQAASMVVGEALRQTRQFPT
jgi:tRNA (cytidine/uridine-2'-O-)-methyltransferase